MYSSVFGIRDSIENAERVNVDWTVIFTDWESCGFKNIRRHMDGACAYLCFFLELYVLNAVVVVVVVYFILSRLLYLAFSANLGLLCMPHPGMGPLV